MASKLRLKLLKYNLGRKIENRISLKEIESKEKIARTRGNNAGLLAKIHLEIAPKLEALRKADDFIENRRKDFVGYVTNHEEGHYNGHVYSIGKETEENLAFANSPEFALVVYAQKMKENITKEKIAEDF
jgi:hypothetical protein